MNYIAETIEFKRPNCNGIEGGLRVSDGNGRSIIIDSDMNIVINCSYHKYNSDSQTFSTTI